MPPETMPIEMLRTNSDGPRGEADGFAHIREMTRRALRSALRADGRGDARSDEGRLALRQACEAAHGRGLHAEELLILLKREWRNLPEVRRGDRVEGEAALARVVSRCIHEFYRRSASPSESARAFDARPCCGT